MRYYRLFEGMICMQQTKFSQELELQQLEHSAELYAEIYADDPEMHILTEGALNGWPA